MVLTARRFLAPQTLFALAALALAAGCVKSHPIVKLPEKVPIAVAFVLDGDHRGLVGEVPQAFKKEVGEILAERNLELLEIPLASDAKAFAPMRDSRRRLARLTDSEAPLTLLIETRALCSAQLSGRNRWTVGLKLTVAPADGSAEPLSASADLSTFVDVEHQKAPAAIASDLAQRVGVLLDEFLSASDLVERKTAVPGELEKARQQEVSATAHSDAIYFVMVDRFANGEPTNDGAIDLRDPAAFHGGDLAGVIEHLDELQEMGVGTIWLSPIFAMRTEKFFGHGAFHGYWVEDFERIEPRFGDEAALARLSDELHRRGMKLVLDIVLNHVAMDSPRVRQTPHWFHGRGPLEDWDDPIQLTTHDVHGLPDLNQANPEVDDYLLKTSLKWISLARPDGFRLDAVKHIPNDFWARYNGAILEATSPEFLLLGEVFDGDPRRLAQTQREGKFSAMFDFPLYFSLIDVFCRGQSPTKLGAVFSSDRIYDRPEALVTLLDNHDLPRIASDCGGDLDRVRQALTFQLTARGTPAINYGTEAALKGAREPENRGDMRFGEQPLRSHIQKLLRLRAQHPALQSGAPLLLLAEAEQLVYARVAGTEVAIIAVNASEKARAFELPPALARADIAEALSGQQVARGALPLPPRSTRLFLLKPQEPHNFSQLAEQAAEQWREGKRQREVRFQAKGLELSAGEQAFIVGSGLEMGVWKPENGLGPFDRDGRLTVRLPVASAYELKLAIRAADGSVRWAGGANEVLFIPEGNGALDVALAW